MITENWYYCLVWVWMQTRCDEVAEALVAQGLNAVALHGGRTQSEREGALRDFRHGPTNILVCYNSQFHKYKQWQGRVVVISLFVCLGFALQVATDVASRGLDVTGVAHVVNLDLPKVFIFYEVYQ